MERFWNGTFSLARDQELIRNTWIGQGLFRDVLMAKISKPAAPAVGDTHDALGKQIATLRREVAKINRTTGVLDQARERVSDVYDGRVEIGGRDGAANGHAGPGGFAWRGRHTQFSFWGGCWADFFGSVSPLILMPAHQNLCRITAPPFTY